MWTVNGMQMRSLFAICLWWAGGAFAAAEVVYTPPADHEQNTRAMQELFKQMEGRAYSFFLGTHELSVADERRFLGAWDMQEDRVIIRVLTDPASRLEIRYENMPPVRLLRDTVLGAPFYGATVGPGQAVWCQAGPNDLRLACGKWLAEMFSALRERHAIQLKGREAFEQRFRAALEKYPTAASRPPFPEEARKFRVQAEVAIDARRYMEAAVLYSRALEVAPWWADGYSNIALVLAEANQYVPAIRNMKRFLLLEPAHPEARKFQDLIYRWEAEAAKK